MHAFILCTIDNINIFLHANIYQYFTFRLSSNVNQGPELWKSVLKTKGKFSQFFTFACPLCIAFQLYVYLYYLRIPVFEQSFNNI